MKFFRCTSYCLLIAIFLTAGGSGLDTGPAWARHSRMHVFLLRGIFNVSVGLDAMAARLTRLGIPSSVYGHGDAAYVAREAIRDYRGGKVKSIILVGHSLGGAAVVYVAEQLNEVRIPVTLLVSLDPVGAGAVPANVRRAVDFYLSDSGGPLAAAPGFHGVLRNVNVTTVPGMDHMAIQSMESMQSRVISEIMNHG
jgi:pimeloyl-ACP methyl ester carboxylesterase